MLLICRGSLKQSKYLAKSQLAAAVASQQLSATKYRSDTELRQQYPQQQLHREISSALTTSNSHVSNGGWSI